MFDNNVIKHKFSDFSRNNTIRQEKTLLLMKNRQITF